MKLAPVVSNGLASSRRQAITWTNDDHVLWREKASLGHNEVTQWATGNDNIASNNEWYTTYALQYGIAVVVVLESCHTDSFQYLK